MTRSQTITVCLWLTIVAVAAALTIRMMKAPPGMPGGDTLVLVSPLFFGMAAKKASHLGRAAVVVALVGLGFGGLALYAAISSKPPAAKPARGR